MKPFTKLLPLFLLGILFLSSCRKKPVSITRQIDTLFSSAPDFSGVLLIAEKGKPVYHKAFGFENFDKQKKTDTTSVFELASVSKQFTAMTIMMLKERGKLNYDDSVAKYIPGLPYPGVTIRHLLNHTSGLPDYQEVMEKNWDKSKVAGNDDNIEYLIKYRPLKHFRPGRAYEYSNTGYMLLASITEKVAQQDFIDFCRENIFTPLQMTTTNIRLQREKAQLPNMAWGYIYKRDKHRYVRADSFPKYNYTIWLGHRTGPGRISSTTADLLKWDRALYTEKLVKKATLEEAFTAAKLKNGLPSLYGFGWALETHPLLGRVVRHSGNNPGYRTHIIRYIDADKTIILLCNNEHKKYQEIVKGVEQIVGSYREITP